MINDNTYLINRNRVDPVGSYGYIDRLVLSTSIYTPLENDRLHEEAASIQRVTHYNNLMQLDGLRIITWLLNLYYGAK